MKQRGEEWNGVRRGQRGNEGEEGMVQKTEGGWRNSLSICLSPSLVPRIDAVTQLYKNPTSNSYSTSLLLDALPHLSQHVGPCCIQSLARCPHLSQHVGLCCIQSLARCPHLSQHVGLCCIQSLARCPPSSVPTCGTMLHPVSC